MLPLSSWYYYFFSYVLLKIELLLNYKVLNTSQVLIYASITVLSWSFFLPSFQLQVVMLQGTGRPNLLIYGSMAGVTNTALAFLSMGWPTQHQACCHQMGFTFLKGERGFLLRSLQGSLAGL